MPKTIAPTDGIGHSSITPPEYVLSLRRLDDHPALAEVVARKERLADALATCETEMMTCRKQIAIYSASSRQGQHDAALNELLRATQQRLDTLQGQHRLVIDQLRVATAEVDGAREGARAALIPTLAAEVLPEIHARLAYLEKIALVAKLLGPRHVKSAAEGRNEQELKHLQSLVALLTAVDPS
jgi:hypothetical protein